MNMCVPDSLRFRGLLLLASLLSCLNIFCQGKLPSEAGSSNPPDKGSWTIYTPFDWAHDGNPVYGNFITVYSDGAGADLKQQVCELAEQQFSDIMLEFQFENTADFIFPPGYNRIDIYINRFHTENIAWAYWGGFLITIRVEPLDTRWQRYLNYTAKHELVHVFEFLIEGKIDLFADVWFKEGLAVYLADPETAGFNPVDTVAELDAWIARNQDHPDQGNPIAIHRQSDFPPNADRTYYYLMFELAIRYLLDERGGMGSLDNVLDLMYDIRNNIAFESSFEDRFELNMEEFETEFYTRLRTYLQ